ncbi:MAG: hypothetical protein KF795_31450 [Labilithrix sp.]|nr:hypothetical protein [Labilithrix sp.]
MHALEVEGEVLDECLHPNDRPTIPVPAPRESGVRLMVARVPWSAVTVDVVICDLSRDPRSESFVPERAGNVSPLRRRARRARRLTAW